MGDLLLNAGIWVTQLLVDVLPDSPITQLISNVNAEWSALSEGLRVLNYFVDINGMVIMLGIWLLVVMALYAKYFALAVSGKLVGSLANIKNIFLTMFGQPLG